VSLNVSPAISHVQMSRKKSSGEPAAALLCVGTYEKAICGWELGEKSAVTAVFTVCIPQHAHTEICSLTYFPFGGCNKLTDHLAAYIPLRSCGISTLIGVPRQHPSHLGPVKAVASQGKFLVSGGNDEEIRIYNVRKRVEVGSLMKHQVSLCVHECLLCVSVCKSTPVSCLDSFRNNMQSLYSRGPSPRCASPKRQTALSAAVMMA